MKPFVYKTKIHQTIWYYLWPYNVQITWGSAIHRISLAINSGSKKVLELFSGLLYPTYENADNACQMN